MSGPALLLLQVDPGGGGLISFMPFILIFFIFYFLLIRPQQKRQKKQEQMLSGIQKGDSVITAGGLHGRVTGLTDDVITLEIASLKGERVRVKVSRDKVDGVVKPGQSEQS